MGTAIVSWAAMWAAAWVGIAHRALWIGPNNLVLTVGLLIGILAGLVTFTKLDVSLD
jgi:hypothetical protein